jgi:hypothetical protein
MVLEALMGTGLAASAGLNADIPLLLVGVLSRFTDVITLPSGGSAAGGDQVPLGAISSLHQGDLIGAIRQTREATGRGLKDSKEAVESYLEAHPHVRDQFRSAARRHGGGVGRLVTFIGLVIIAALVVLWLSGRV